MSSKLTKLLTPLDNQRDLSDDIFPNKPFNMALIGPKGCGKSSLLLNLLIKKGSPLYKRFNLIFLISPTCAKDEKMHQLMDDIGQDQIFEELTPDVLEHIINTINFHKENYNRKNPEYCIIYDDCIHFLKQKNNNKKLSELFTQNRHYKLSNIILLQKWSGYMPTIIRCNLDCLAIYKLQSKKEEENVIEELNGNEDELKLLYQIATDEPFSFLFINQYLPNRTRYYKRFDLLFQNY